MKKEPKEISYRELFVEAVLVPVICTMASMLPALYEWLATVF